MKVNITTNFQLLNYFMTRLEEIIPYDKYELKTISIPGGYHDLDANYHTIWLSPRYQISVFLSSIDIRIRLFYASIPLHEVSPHPSSILSLRLYVKLKDKQIYLLKELQYDE